MKTIEVTDKVFELLKLYVDKDTSYSKIIKWWHDEVFSTRLSTLSDKDFGR